MRTGAPERLAAGGAPATKRHVAHVKRAALQVLAPAELHEVRRGVDARHVAWLAERDAKALALADRVRRRAPVLADERPSPSRSGPGVSCQPARARSASR